MAREQERVDVVVAADDTGNYRTINEAIAAAPTNSSKRYVVHIKAGTYNEVVKVGGDKPNLKLVGDGMDKTRIVGSLGVDNGCRTSGDTAIVSVHANGFIAQELSIENTAGQKMDKGWAVALLIEAEQAVIYRCALISHQDTLSAWKGKHFYRECNIYGTVDFIYGLASAVFQSCNLLVRRPLQTQTNTVTAQGRNSATEETGFVFQRCTVDAAPGEDTSGVKTYLGRPYGLASRTVFMESTISGIVDPEGWLQWENTPPSDGLYYAEYKNTGAGADVSGRVRWKGVGVIHDDAEARPFTVANFIGYDWVRSTGVRCDAGL